MNIDFKNDQPCLGCGVPMAQHGTCCGWENAGFIVFPWENISLNISGEEKKKRYDAMKQYFLSMFPVKATSSTELLDKPLVISEEEKKEEHPAITCKCGNNTFRVRYYRWDRLYCASCGEKRH